MELSILASRVLAVVYLASAIAAICGKINFAKIANDFQSSSGLTLTTGFISILVGVFLVSYHNIWVKDWVVLVTIVGWLALIKGVLLIVLPQFIAMFKGLYKNNLVWGLLMLILGLLFGYFGFIAA
jgi:uncharacterized membrane protein HdeD (DUF308 family)